MNKIILCLVILGLVVPMRATPPLPLELFDRAFARFCESYVCRCEDLLRELRTRVPLEAQEEDRKSFDGLDQYLRNIRSDDISAVQRILDKRSDELLAVWCDRLTHDIVGFRRTLDRLVIVNVAKMRLRVDDKLLATLEKFWEQESYFSWRFGREVSAGVASRAKR